jgi:hypothetical protein
MKKLTAILVALALFFNASAFTPFTKGKGLSTPNLKIGSTKSVTSENVSAAVSIAFKQKFALAENVNWKQNESLYFAIFEMNEKEYSVAYSDEAELIAISIIIPKDQLPLAVTESLKGNYINYKLPQTMMEIAMQGSTNYYFTVEGKTSYLQLKCNPDGNISVEKKIKKKILLGTAY